MFENDIKREEEILVYSDPNNPWVELYFDRVRFPNGHMGRYNRIMECKGKQGVAVLPIMDGKVGLVRQFRYPIGEEVWEIPRGFAAPDTDSRQQALRELEEETGISDKFCKLVELSKVHPNSGLLSSEVQLYAALTFPGQEYTLPTDSETSRFQWFPVSEVLESIKKGGITDVFTLSAILIARELNIL
ncbi:NUDIX hydrolase [Desulfobacca acetoxidans]